MKRLFLIISLLLLLLLIGCSKQLNLNNSAQEYLTDNSFLAQKIAWDSLTEGEVKSILPQAMVTVAKVETSTIPLQIENTNPTNVYKVTYSTIMDALLGPIGIYVDVETAEIVGYDVRH
ncbi:MAG: hypothetical protein NAG76_00520 [Candidatus Pristimantibacillus lignocellulolyticus]|uniref:Uncharacterized protein n=1 Tax=Candidatus Pristimantibacillus lignocellulolyticus TaxID=2994561 RepID=A0A9J6ZFF1_9BACL|nr:MAG: hypothetical protein NAG76_00520 [Candidatus Pristimantibacillus lignocellulolyticus]